MLAAETDYGPILNGAREVVSGEDFQSLLRNRESLSPALGPWNRAQEALMLSAAVHEAGHIAAAVSRFERTVLGAILFGPGTGHTLVMTDTPMIGEGLCINDWEHAAIHLAGMAAEHLLLGAFPQEEYMADDFAKAVRRCRIIEARGKVVPDALLPPWPTRDKESVACALPPLFARLQRHGVTLPMLMTTAYRRGYAILQERPPLLADLAAALLVHRQLDRHAIREILRNHEAA